MTSISIIGRGTMGQAIQSVFERAGASVQLVGRDDAATGDVVVLAVPYAALADIAAQRQAELAGKIVVDITNPVDFATFDSLTVAPDASAAAELASALPSSHVLKAFNTNFGATLASGVAGDQPTTVLVAGDDADAKASLIAAITPSGVKALDAGSLKRARELEAIGFLQISLAASEKIGWTGGFAVVA